MNTNISSSSREKPDRTGPGIWLSALSCVFGKYRFFRYLLFGLLCHLHKHLRPPALFAIPSIQFSSALELLLYAILGLVCVPFGYVYVKTFYGLRDRLFRKLPIPRALIPACGGLLVGLIALWRPEILSGGYGAIQKALESPRPLSLGASGIRSLRDWSGVA